MKEHTFGDWNPIFTAQLAAILEEKRIPDDGGSGGQDGPTFEPECDDDGAIAPIKCQTPTFGPENEDEPGAAPIKFQARRPEEDDGNGNYGPARYIDIEDEDDIEWGRAARPINGDSEGPMFGPEGNDGGWDSAIKAQSNQTLINCEEDEEDGCAAIKCGEADAPIMGDFGPAKALRFGDSEGPIMGEPLDRPHYGDFSPVLGGDFGPSFGDADGPILLGDFSPSLVFGGDGSPIFGDFSPVLGDWSPSKAEHMHIIRLRPFIPPMKYGDDSEYDGEWSSPIKCGEADAPIFGKDDDEDACAPIKYQVRRGREDEEDAAIKCGEPTGPLYGDGIAPIRQRVLVAC